MSMTPENLGTEAATPAGEGAVPEAQPTPTPDGELQAKYDALLGRISEAEAIKAENSRLVSLINERLEPNAPPAQPDEIATRMERFEQNLLYTLHNGQSEAEKDAAAALLGMFNFTRGLPGQFSEQMAMAPLDVATREQVKAVMKEAAASGNRITPDYAREVVNLRAQQAELTKLRAGPTPQPPNTRVVPSPVPVAPRPGNPADFGTAWGQATPEQQDQMIADFRSGKYHLKPA